MRHTVRRNRLWTVPTLKHYVLNGVQAAVRNGHQRPAAAVGYELLGLAHQAGMATATVRAGPNHPGGAILLHDGEKVWLLWPSSGAWLSAAELTELIATPEVGKDVTAILVPASPLDFCLRTQILGHVLRRTLGPGAPVLGDSPTLRRQTWRELLETEEEGVGESARTRPSVEVDFDLGLFTDFAERWRVKAVPVNRSEAHPPPH